MLDIIQIFDCLFGLSLPRSSPHFHDLSLENLQRLLNQRIVLEIVLVERFVCLPASADGAGLVALGRHSAGSARQGLQRLRLSFRGCAAQSAGRSALTNLICVPAWPSSRQLGLQQCVIARVVHEAHVVLKFRIKTDGNKVPLKATGCASSK